MTLHIPSAYVRGMSTGKLSNYFDSLLSSKHEEFVFPRETLVAISIILTSRGDSQFSAGYRNGMTDGELVGYDRGYKAGYEDGADDGLAS